ncbi:MAG TPA: twin-arginine translocase TatA/TatE family subunit [Thermoleophilia bacterium]|nr:twin-arginine translocase TatA/TatE family subunit [Thermoleophilia bacterium]
MPNIGLPELAIILVIVLLLFGATRLPKLGKSMGQGIKGFKDGLNEGANDEDDETKQVEQAPTAQASAQLPPAPQQAQPVQPVVQQAPPVQQAPQAQPPVQQPPAQPASEQPQGWTPQPPQPPTPPQA